MKGVLIEKTGGPEVLQYRTDLQFQLLKKERFSSRMTSQASTS